MIKEQISLRIYYQVAPYDFWTGISERLTVGTLRLAAGALANKIYETLTSSKAEKDEFQSSRFDLIIPPRQNSWIIVRIIRSAKFRTNATIEEADIRNAIMASVDKFDALSKRNPRKTLLIAAELRNDGDEIRLIIEEETGFSIDSALSFKKQLKDVLNRGSVTKI